MLYGAINFRTTVIKPYYTKQTLEIIQNEAVLDNGEERDEAESDNKNKIEESE